MHTPKQKVHCHPVGIVNHNRHLFHPPPTEENDPYPTCGLTEDSYFRSFYRYFHHFIHRPDAGYGFLTVFMQNILGYSAVQIGLLLTPWPLATILTAPLAGRLVEKVHPGLLGGIGMAIFATGLFTLYLLPPHPAEWNIIWRMALCGMGFGLFQTPNNVTIVSSAPTHRSGGASGMLGTARLLGQTLGTTLVALLFRMFAEGHRAQACLLLAIFFAIAAGVVSSIRMTQASPAGKK